MRNHLWAICAFALLGCTHAAKTENMPPQNRKYDAELSGYDYPYSVQTFALTSQTQNLKMAYMDVQPEKPNGKTVLLLHGKNFPASYWGPTIKSITAQGFRVIAPDQIGFGKSSKPHSYQFSFQTLATNTRAILDSLGIKKAHVVGHSMGGMLATRFTLMYPDFVEKLVLVNPIGLEDWKTMTDYKPLDQAYQAELKSSPETIREYQKSAYYDGQWKPEYDVLAEAPMAWTKDPDFPKVAWNSALTADMIFTQPVVYEFGNLRAPTLLIIGQRDRTAIGKAWAKPDMAKKMGDYPALGKKTAKAIRGSRLVEINGVGHMPMIEAFPVYEKALVSFLSQ